MYSIVNMYFETVVVRCLSVLLVVFRVLPKSEDTVIKLEPVVTNILLTDIITHYLLVVFSNIGKSS